MLWRNQMVIDISSIIDNMEYPLERLGRFSQNATLKTMADEIADMYYQAIYAVVEPDGSEPAAVVELGKALIMEICTNLGIDVFDDLASEWVSG